MILSKENRISIFILCLLLVLSAFRIAFIDYPRYQKLVQRHSFTVAEITQCRYGGRSLVQKVKYTFSVSDESYIVNTGLFSEKVVKGQKFIVVFNPSKPQLSFLLINHPLDSSYALGQKIPEEEVGDYEMSFWEFTTGGKVQ